VNNLHVSLVRFRINGSGLHGMLMWITKYLCVLLIWTSQLHVLVGFNLIVLDIALLRWIIYMLRYIASGV
jgi:hypothetical protein